MHSSHRCENSFSSSFLGLALSNKFLPVHCVVARDECPQRVLQDGFVIVPAQTKFHEIVSVVLRTMEADVGKIEQDERADGKKENQFLTSFFSHRRRRRRQRKNNRVKRRNLFWRVSINDWWLIIGRLRRDRRNMIFLLGRCQQGNFSSGERERRLHALWEAKWPKRLPWRALQGLE